MTNLELLQSYRRLNAAQSQLVQELAGLVIHGATIHVETIDSHVLLEILQNHNKVVKEINDEIFGEADA